MSPTLETLGTQKEVIQRNMREHLTTACQGLSKWTGSSRHAEMQVFKKKGSERTVTGRRRERLPCKAQILDQLALSVTQVPLSFGAFLLHLIVSFAERRPESGKATEEDRACRAWFYLQRFCNETQGTYSVAGLTPPYNAPPWWSLFSVLDLH